MRHISGSATDLCISFSSELDLVLERIGEKGLRAQNSKM